MFITLLVVGCLGAVAGQGDAFEPYLREHKAFGKAVAAMICLYGEYLFNLSQTSALPIVQFTDFPVFAFNLAWGPIAWVVYVFLPSIDESTLTYQCR